MGWRFRKRIKIFPGFYINISKSGLGFNIGPKGANVSIGPNGTYVNIQFGDKGFSLKEFNKTNIEGESVLDAIVETWGYTDHPFSFCYLGRANYEYEKLKEKLREIKNEELKRYKDKGSVYYHLVNRNCQHFACDLERILFGSIQLWHSFDYYLQDFYKAFFSEINIDVLKSQLRNKIDTMR